MGGRMHRAWFTGPRALFARARMGNVMNHAHGGVLGMRGTKDKRRTKSVHGMFRRAWGRMALRPLGWSLCVCVLGVASAQVVPDRNAPGGEQPTVLGASNGVPVVNIQTPSPGGVSRNAYQQFDVDRQGAILNNARGAAVQTQLGGWILGNPHLSGGSAKVILNEVNSANPSQLRGYIEVGGQRTQVVIANPAGIDCDGCGFIVNNGIKMTP